MAELTGSNLIELVAELRRFTELPWAECKQLLAPLTAIERERLIANAAVSRQIVYDPIEHDPAVRPLFLAAYQEATREVQEAHRAWIATTEPRSPAVAAMLKSGRGLCHRTWERTKQIMAERHGVVWRTPAEMNPLTQFD